MDRIVNCAFLAHDLYVNTYECIGSMASGVLARIPNPFPLVRPALNRLTNRPIEMLYNAIVAGVSRTIQLSNVILRRPRNETMMRALRPEIKGFLEEAKSEITKLSKECSVVFDRTIIFSKIPSEEETQEILDKLLQFKENANYLTDLRKEAAADRAILACMRLHNIHEQLEPMRGEEISSRDIEAFQESLGRNVLLTMTVGATVENIGEMVGGAIVDEGSPFISEEWNPAIQLGKIVAEHIGRRAGRLMGVSLGLSGIYYLLSQLPLMRYENQRTMIQVGAMLSMVIIECMHRNPLTNYLEEQMEDLSYDFAFYSVALLFNYIGMCMAGTEEPLGSYVRNMTPSMFVYNGLNFAFEKIGFEGVVAGILSFYLSHVAYNFDLYQGLYKGTLLDQSFELDEIGATANQRQIQSMRRSMTSILLKELSQRMHHINRAQLNAAIDPTINVAREMFPIADPLIVEAKNQGMDQAAQRFMQAVMEGIPRDHEFHEWNQGEDLEQELGRLKNRLPCSEIAFLFREGIHFFEFLKDPDMKTLLEEHKKEYLNVIAQSKSEDLDGGQGPYLPFEESRKRIFKALLEVFYAHRAEEIVESFRPIWDGEKIPIDKALPKEVMDFLVNEMHIPPEGIVHLHRIWDPKVPFEIDKAVLRRYIEPRINEQLEKLYPLIPTTSPEDEACSVYMMEMLTRALIIYSKLRVFTGKTNPAFVMKLQKEDYLNFLKLVTDFIFEIRFPSQFAFSDWRRAGARRLIHSQCNGT